MSLVSQPAHRPGRQRAIRLLQLRPSLARTEPVRTGQRAERAGAAGSAISVRVSGIRPARGVPTGG